ncbi:MAG: hypothetical protein O2944_02470 [Proteobacteria bacterium]|nr:hypothetical protein [Pseudomonadota bacterium]
MSHIHCSLVLVLVAVAALAGFPAPPPAVAAELSMTQDESTYSENLRKFLNRLFENLQIAYPKFSQDWGIDGFETGEADLNGDGVPELFVSYISTFFAYGNFGRSMVSVYQRRGDWWAYVGQVSGRGDPPGIQIEDKTYNGWKIIRYDKSYFCWSDKDNLRGDMFLTPHNKYGAGYRGGTSDTKPCP